jgi:hypothetical protein
MSLSPPIRRLSTSSKRGEDLINAFEAEEERILNVLSRKLEKVRLCDIPRDLASAYFSAQLREEKVQLENVLEAESESHVNRLTRELTALRLAQQAANSNGTAAESPESRPGFMAFIAGPSSQGPTVDTLLQSLQGENEDLRRRLVDMERDYVRVVRLNEIYREELIEHRHRVSEFEQRFEPKTHGRSQLGLPMDNLVGLGGVPEPAPPPGRRSASYSLIPTSPPTYPSSMTRLSSTVAIPTGVPIPRPSSRIYRPSQPSLPSPPTPTSASASGSGSQSPSPLVSPLLHRTADAFASAGTSYVSGGTGLTTPASAGSLHATPPDPFRVPNGNGHVLGTHGATGGGRILSYPSVPPPSLSSSLGSPTAPFFLRAGADPSSPAESRGAVSPQRGRERGSARIAETGSLRPRRPSAQGAAQAAEAPAPGAGAES